jgi:ribose-phosphate pyrophosphokinase
MAKLKIFSGNANLELSKKIADLIPEATLVPSLSTTFKDGEIQIDLKESVRGCDIFIVQPTASTSDQSINDSIMELLIYVDALKRASAASVNLVIPYFGYARQDRKVGTRTPITARLVADLIETAGADRIITMDLHADQIQGFFKIPVENLNATRILANYFKSKNLSDVVVVSPDMGGAKRAGKLAKLLGDVPIAIVNKNRPAPNVSEVLNIVGEVRNKNVILIDDMIDTGGTICNAAVALREAGAKLIFVAATHGVLSGEAIENLSAAPIDQTVVCDTVYIAEAKKSDRLKIISVAELLAQAIEHIHRQEPLTELIL